MTGSSSTGPASAGKLPAGAGVLHNAPTLEVLQVALRLTRAELEDRLGQVPSLVEDARDFERGRDTSSDSHDYLALAPQPVLVQVSNVPPAVPGHRTVTGGEQADAPLEQAAHRFEVMGHVA